jgi:hypothetical protein
MVSQAIPPAVAGLEVIVAAANDTGHNDLFIYAASGDAIGTGSLVVLDGSLRIEAAVPPQLAQPVMQLIAAIRSGKRLP